MYILSYHLFMNLITTDISNFRNNLSDFLTLVSLGKSVVSVKNAKSGKEVVRIVSPFEKEEAVGKREKELLELAGYASGTGDINRKKLKLMDKKYVSRLKKGIIE